MATRKINTFIEHLVNENLAATQAAVTAGAAVKEKKRDKAGRRLLDMDTEMFIKSMEPKIGDMAGLALQKLEKSKCLQF